MGGGPFLAPSSFWGLHGLWPHSPTSYLSPKDTYNDHRIAMSAAVAASRCPVTVLGSECVSKSYPRFWEDYAAVKGETL